LESVVANQNGNKSRGDVGTVRTRHSKASGGNSPAALREYSQPRSNEIHVIADNLADHKCRSVTDYLAVYLNVHLRFTSAYSSWLNQVDLWFGKIERDVIARGVFTSAWDLKRKLLRYIRQYNKSLHTVKWKYADPSRRPISTQSAGIGH
jgi:transposase